MPLAAADKQANVDIVSGANPAAVLEERERHGLLPYTDIVLSQDAGSKAYCISELLKKGYDPNKVRMCGDAPAICGQLRKNGVFYFPILVRRERESWEEFIAEGFGRLLSGSYGGAYQDVKKQPSWKTWVADIK